MSGIQDVFLGLGGNIGDTRLVLREVLSLIGWLPKVFDIQCSRLYRTSPVSAIPQRDYVNAVCSLKTTWQPHQLFQRLKEIESSFGVREARQDAPRIIDIDILFFGGQVLSCDNLQIPHPRWQQRLFVLRPLSDLISHLTLADGSCYDIIKMIEEFPLCEEQRVWPCLEETPLSNASNTMVGTA